MYLIVGLGNPGKEYEKTRHNFGFMAIDKLVEFWRANPVWAEEFYEKEKHDSWLIEFEIFSGQTKHLKEPGKEIVPQHLHIVLAKPQTMMNNSGLAVKKLKQSYKLKSNQIIVIHDDIDLPLCTFKVSYGAGAAGHKGVESIISHLKTKNFHRLRLGIRPNIKRIPTEEFVLKKFTKDEQAAVIEVLQKIPDIINKIVTKVKQKT